MSTGDVSGTVTFGDRPVTSGTVMAVGKDGVPHYGDIAATGDYKIEKLPRGKIIWAVTSPDPTAAIVPRPPFDQPSITAPATPKPHGAWFPIPDRYTLTSLADLRCELQSSSQRYDIKLTE
ncbi:MAG TPA: hypothetical protein VGG64_27665 [Pirellulales bacterium]|jgi:hypothetical protein